MKKKLLTPVIILALTVFLNACGGQADTPASSGDSADAPISEDNSVNDAAVVSDLEETPVEDFQYEYDADTQGIKITAYTGTSIKVRIPDRIEGEPVTCIGKNVFEDSDVMEVVIPDTVTVIGERAFCNCTQLANIVIPDGVTVIGDSAFRYCTGLVNIVIPDGVTQIGSIGVDKMTVDDEINRGGGAFFGCSGLTRVEIPGSIIKIDNSAFARCTGLTEVIIHRGVEVIGAAAFFGCDNLTSISIADSVTKIEFGAFQGCKSISSIDLPDSVSEIGDMAFFECVNLTDETKQKILEIDPNCSF